VVSARRRLRRVDAAAARPLNTVEACRTVTQLSNDLQTSGQTIYAWRRKDAVDNGPLPGVTSTEHAGLA
jgi:hypothetical protein